LHPKYDYADFLGGIMLIRKEHFVLAKGMSNNYWGWGLEDDEFARRLKEANLSVKRPENVNTGKEKTFKHVHPPRRRRRDYEFCYNQRDVTRRRDRVTGLHDVKYRVLDRRELSVNGVGNSATVLDISLECDRAKTPWCDCSEAPKTEAPVVQPDDPNDVVVPKLKRKKKRKKS